MYWDRVKVWNICAVRRLAWPKTQPSGMSTRIPATTLPPRVSTSPVTASVEQMRQRPVRDMLNGLALTKNLKGQESFSPSRVQGRLILQDRAESLFLSLFRLSEAGQGRVGAVSALGLK